MINVYSFNRDVPQTSRIAAVLQSVIKNETRASSIQGAESLSEIFGAENFSLGNNINPTYSQKQSGVNAAKSIFDNDQFVERSKEIGKKVEAYGGFESFSNQLSEGSVARQKAATLELNINGNIQFKAAEFMYPTVTIGYGEEVLELPIEVGGVGSYNVGGNVYDQFEDLRPIPSILSDSTFSSGDDLRLVPVYTADANNPNSKVFVDTATWKPFDVTYDQNDLLGRENHKTNFLKPVKLMNLMNLCQAPGTSKWENNDEIDPSSIRATRVLFKIKTKDGEGVFALDTANHTGNAMRPNGNLNSKSSRQLILKEESTPLESLVAQDGKNAVDLFKSLGKLKARLQWNLRLEYNLNSRNLDVTVSPEVSIHHVVDENGNRTIISSSKSTADLEALIKAQALEATIVGYELAMDHNNVNWSRYGQTIVYASNIKFFNVRPRTPISVKYPMEDQDTNTEVLGRCIKDMGLVISRNMTHDAFKSAIKHFEYLKEHNGKKVVPINDNSNNVLPGQHFFTTTAVVSDFSLKEATSTLDSKSALENVQAVLVNKITDVLTEMRVKSGFSAVKEIDGREESYVIVAHASLAPYLITTGDVRTFGENVKFEVVETNIDTEVGRFWVFPKSQTKDGSIDAFGGMGINVARDLHVIEGDVRMDSRQYRMMICQPAYQHHSVGCICARVQITDIADLMNDGGVLSSINKHLVEVSGKLKTEAAGGNGTTNEVPVEQSKSGK